jgi:ABC-2 type transport system ATP-binding protein/lipopolysaccharide transport system ATP-binding protein
MPSILVQNVSIDFPVIGTGARSFRHTAFAKASRFRPSRVGGQVIESESTMSVVRALDSINFSLSSGDRLGLMGPNGAGKTTLIRALAGIYEPVTGHLDVEGKRIPMFDINIGLDDEATGYENIYIRGLIMGLSAKRIDHKTAEIAEYSGLGDYLNMPIRTYSAGMVLRLMFAIATSIEGDIVLMDEWLAVGDAQFREKTQARLMGIAESAGILVLASHDMGLLKNICNLGLHIEGGKVKRFGPINEVLSGLAESNKVH